MLTTIPAHSLGNTTFFLHTFIINLHSPFFFILTHLYSYFVILFYPLKTVDQTVESLYFLNIFSQRSSVNFKKKLYWYLGFSSYIVFSFVFGMLCNYLINYVMFNENNTTVILLAAFISKT